MGKLSLLNVIEVVGISLAGGVMVTFFYVAAYIKWMLCSELLLLWIAIIAFGVGFMAADVKRGMGAGFLTSIIAFVLIEIVLILPASIGIIGETHIDTFIYFTFWTNVDYLLILSVVIVFSAMIGGLFGEGVFRH